MATEHIYIISDLHLGGRPALQSSSGTTSGFQLCQPRECRRLAQFIHYISGRHVGEHTELIINGDFVDFLTEEKISSESPAPTQEFEAFTIDREDAIRKFNAIVEHTDASASAGERLFEALREFVQRGHRLTILLGNHDIELCLPSVRLAMTQMLTGGRLADLEFIHDGEAYVRPGLIVEHGNRYDGWNALSYGALRAWRSAQSRNEEISFQFPPPPGSRLVASLMNPLKHKYKFIDLLKPENEALVPVLAALDSSILPTLTRIVRGLPYLAKKMLVQTSAGGIPSYKTYIADDQAVDDEPVDASRILGDPISEETITRSNNLLAFAIKEWGHSEHGGETNIADEQSSFGGALALVRQYLPSSKHNSYGKLRRTLMLYRETIGATFDLETESPIYLRAASRLAEGKRIVAFGHTHLAKRKTLQYGGMYLNTGTWCPTIKLPTDICDPNAPDEQVFPLLKQFIEDLAENRTASWTQVRATFAKVTLDGNATQGDLFEFCEDGSIRRADWTNAG